MRAEALKGHLDGKHLARLFSRRHGPAAAPARSEPIMNWSGQPGPSLHRAMVRPDLRGPDLREADLRRQDDASAVESYLAEVTACRSAWQQPGR